ncbi:hypothetical protein HN51_036723, partial [Arachis hypogaea]
MVLVKELNYNLVYSRPLLLMGELSIENFGLSLKINEGFGPNGLGILLVTDANLLRLAPRAYPSFIKTLASSSPSFCNCATNKEEEKLVKLPTIFHPKASHNYRYIEFIVCVCLLTLLFLFFIFLCRFGSFNTFVEKILLQLKLIFLDFNNH